ncbi:MAG: hypothetical protein ABFD53_12740 [Anaerolineaceae bacterium]
MDELLDINTANAYLPELCEDFTSITTCTNLSHLPAITPGDSMATI